MPVAQDSEKMESKQRDSQGSTGSRGQAENIKKVAVTMASQQALFMELDQNRPLAAIIQDICDKWTITLPDDFSLQFSEPTRQTYITERNRADIQNGNVLNLTDSPVKTAQKIIDKLKSGNREEKLESLKSLETKSKDATFAAEFISKAGLKLIIDLVVTGTKTFSGDPLKFLLCSFVALMDHGSQSWDTLDPKFIEQVANCVSGTRATSEGCTRPCLEILENVIVQSPDLKSTELYITADKIIPYIQRIVAGTLIYGTPLANRVDPDETAPTGAVSSGSTLFANTSNHVTMSQTSDVQQSAIALINAIFIKSSPEKKQKLLENFQSRQFRTVITSTVLSGSHNVGPEMAHQLYKLQRLILNMYESRMQTKLNQNDTAQMNWVNTNIEELRTIAFPYFSDFADSSSRKSTVSKDYKKLGFSNPNNPAHDFLEVPPGLLAMDNMIHFATNQKENYIKVVLENFGQRNEQDCPFVEASIKLTMILCDLLKIGEPPYDEEQMYYPMFFTVDKPLEEFFACCIQLLNRTWKEMRASQEDFPKVLTVVKEQITRALDKHQMPKTFDAFRTKLVTLAYPELKKIWEAERAKKDESKAQAKPILELRETVKPEIMDLIKKQRLMYLERGSRFPKYDKTNKVKRQFQYWRLSPNHKAFHYGNIGDSGEMEPSIEQLPNKLPVIDIKDLLLKSQCPHIKTKKGSQPDLFAFSIVLEKSGPDEENYHHFLANTEQEFNMWVDGIDALLNNKMSSRQTKEDMDVLLNMEIKLRLLETEGIPIPKDPPPIPPLPDNFNFAYKSAVPTSN